MSTAVFSAANSRPAPGHPLWHFALLAGVGLATFAGIKALEWWRRREHRLVRPSLPIIGLSALGLAGCSIHASVCAEHFREWIVYGVFFLLASAAQAAWSVAVLFRPDRRMLVAGAAGSLTVVGLFLFSRFVGIPFGPDAFQPEEWALNGILASVSELALAGLALYVVRSEKSSPRAQPWRMAALSS